MSTHPRSICPAEPCGSLPVNWPRGRRRSVHGGDVWPSAARLCSPSRTCGAVIPTPSSLLYTRSRRGPGRPRAFTRRGDADDPREGVRDPGRHPAADRLGAPPSRRLGEIAADSPYYSGKHKRHGMNVQVLTDPFRRLLWASPALPGSTHDLTAARHHGIIDALTEAGLKCWADKAYQGAGGPVRVPFRGRRLKGSAATTPVTPRSDASANELWPRSRTGVFCGSSAAAPTGSPTW